MVTLWFDPKVLTTVAEPKPAQNVSASDWQVAWAAASFGEFAMQFS